MTIDHRIAKKSTKEQLKHWIASGGRGWAKDTFTGEVEYNPGTPLPERVAIYQAELERRVRAENGLA